LARHFLGAGLRLSPAAEQVLQDWHWPGNVRELQNVVQRASLLCDGDTIEPGPLRSWLSPHGGAAAPFPIPAAAPIGEASGDPIDALVGRTLHDVERQLVERTLERCNGNRTRTAQMLGIGVRTLFNRLQRETQETR
jgi:DNA-binding NtrC family response regulator